MKCTVKRVLGDTLLELSKPWVYHGRGGTHLRIAGLLPAPSRRAKSSERVKLANLLEGKTVGLGDHLFVNAGVLTAVVLLGGKSVVEFFDASRRTPILDPSRHEAEFDGARMSRVLGGLPIAWSNPIARLDPEEAPYFGNLQFPTRPWEHDYERRRLLVEKLYVDQYHNSESIGRWWRIFRASPTREAPFMIVGEVGIGKSWFLARSLMMLPSADYHSILIDLRRTRRGEHMEASIHRELDEHLTRLVPNLEWLAPELTRLFGESLSFDDPEVLAHARTLFMELTVEDRNWRCVRHYDAPDTPTLIVAFDNIDHHTSSEQRDIIGICQRVLGSRAGVRIIIAMRPTTAALKDRLGAVFGDSLPRPLAMTSPRIEEVLRRRLSVTALGQDILPSAPIAGSGLSWGKLLEIFLSSSGPYGLARFMKELCCTAPLGTLSSEYSGFSNKYDPFVKYDVRHYLRLFRHVLRSDQIISLRNIDNLYFGVHALIRAGSEPMDESESFLFNLFDNDEPDSSGNALIRYRVLEYFRIWRKVEGQFDVYFLGLGIGGKRARLVLEMFETCGLIELDYSTGVGVGPQVALEGRLTVPGSRHLDIIMNLWYIISVKTGMYIDHDLILYGDAARSEASRFVKSELVLKFYETHGWVSEDDFIKFLSGQEMLEGLRISEAEERFPENKTLIRHMTGQRSFPSQIVHESYHSQIRAWS